MKEKTNFFRGILIYVSPKIKYDRKNTKAEGAERSAMDKYGKTASGQPE